MIRQTDSRLPAFNPSLAALFWITNSNLAAKGKRARPLIGAASDLLREIVLRLLDVAL